MISSEPDIEVLGQKYSYPKTAWACVGLALFMATIVSVVWILATTFRDAPAERVNLVLQLFTLRNQGAGKPPKIEETHKNTKLVEFWSPSSKTKEDLERDGTVADEIRWETKVTDADVDDFGEKLYAKFHGKEQDSSGTLKGYRRFEVTGHGGAHLKRGWWWILNVDNDFDKKDLAEFYFQHWPEAKNVYIEERQGMVGYQSH